MSATTMTTTNGAQVQQAPQGAGGLRGWVESPEIKAQLERVATSLVTSDVLVRGLLMAASKNPEILKCSKASILRCLADAAALEIIPGGLMGRGYLVPRKGELCFDPGWRGLVDVARRSGEIKRIEAHVVYEADEFEVTRTPFTTVRHVPSESAEASPVRAAYAVVELKDGAVQIEIVWKKDLDKIRKLGANGGPWASWYDEMARKTAVRRICKYLPFNPLMERALAAATEAEADEPIGRFEGNTIPNQPPQAKRLAEKISARIAVDEEAEEAMFAQAEAGEPEPGPQVAQAPTPEPVKQTSAKASTKKAAKPVEVDENGVHTGEVVPPPRMREPGDDDF